MALKSELMAASAPAALANKLGFDTPATVASAGSNQATATVLSANYANVTSGTGGVQIPNEKIAAVVNTSGVSCNVYPPSGMSINGLSANAAFAVGNNKQAIFIQAGTVFLGILSA